VARIRTTKPAGEEGWKALADGTTVVFATTPAFGEGEPVPGIGRNPDFAAAAFALAPDGPGIASDPVEVPRGWAILRLREEKPARVPTLAEVEPRVRAAAQRDKANRLAESRAQTARAAILAGAKLDDVVTPLGLEIKESGEFTKAGSIPGLGAASALAEAAFAANPGEVPAPVVIAQGAVLFELVAKSGFDRNRYASERDSTRASLKSEASRKLLEALLRERRTELGVRYDPDLAERLNLAGAGRNG
jgi:cell pole-organizing protein PopZ